MILGVDIGGTKIGVGLVTKSGILRSHAIYRTESSRGKTAVLRNIKTAIANHMTPQVTAIGVGIAGQVDHATGIVRGSPNLPKDFKNVRLAEMLRREFHKPVFIDNDAHCFTLAEAIVGAGKNHGHVFGVTLGTGIGGGMVDTGSIVHGSTNTAAEVGHMIIRANEARCALSLKDAGCGCECAGHLESFASARGMLRRYKEKTRRTIDALELEKLYKIKDAAAVSVVHEAACALAVGLTNVLVTTNPDCIVLGGGLIGFREYIALALAEVPKLVPFPHLKKTPILRAKLGTKAGVVGAALLITN